MKNSASLKILGLVILMFIKMDVWAQGLPDPSNLTDSQRACLEKTIGRPEGGPPPMSQIQAAMDECVKHTATKTDVKPASHETEAQICVACEAEKNRLQSKNIEDIKKIVVASGQGVDSPKLALQGAAPETEEMKKHMQRLKDRMIKKIQSSPCKMPGQDDDDDSDSPDMMLMMGGGDRPSGGRDMPDMGKEGMTKMFAGNLDMMDDIQDAMDAKVEKCQKQARRQMKSRNGMPGGGSSQMSGMGMSGMGMSGMGMSGFGNYGFGSRLTMPTLIMYNPSSYSYSPYFSRSYMQSYR